MRNAVLPIIALLAACNSPAANDRAAGKVRADASAEKSLLAANARYDAALIAGDAGALERFYTDDFRIIDSRAEIHGKADQIKFMTEKVDLIEAKTDEVRTMMIGENMALLTGRLKGRYRLDGKESDFTERYTSIWVRDGDDWRLRHEHSSLAPKPQ